MANFDRVSGSGARVCGLGKLIRAAAAGALGILTMVAVSAPMAHAKGVSSCPASITECGCTITDASLHTLGANLTASQGLTSKGDCIDIAHSSATLDGEFFDVEGSGAGVGIHILKGAKNVAVQNFDEIDDWNVGIEDDDGALVSEIDNIDDNTTAGVFLNSAKGSAYSDLFAEGNGVAGYMLKGSDGNNFDDFSANDNGVGVSLVSSNGNDIHDFDADHNTGDGLTLDKSKNNFFNDFDSDDNSGNGVTFMNSSKNALSDYETGGNTSDGIFLESGSSGNTLDDADNTGNGKNGVEVSSGSTSNSIFFNTATGNTGTDLVDGNTACDKDTWANNCFNTESQSCIGVIGSRC